jgi:hypothetical protein
MTTIAKGTFHGEDALMVSITAEDVARMKQGEAVVVDLRDVGIPYHALIAYGESEADAHDALANGLSS